MVHQNDENTSQAGRVWAHTGHLFTSTNPDILIIGAGRMGSLLAHYLSSRESKKNILVVEAGGLPNEEGATLLAPGIWNPHTPKSPTESINLPLENCLDQSFDDIQYFERQILYFGLGKSDQTPSMVSKFSDLTTTNTDPYWLTLLNIQELTLTHHALAATYRPGSLAISAMKTAISQGCNLMLNTRAHFVPNGIRLDRLSVTNTHQIVVQESHIIQPRKIIMAAGAHGPRQLEQELGHHTRHSSAYVQYPHLNYPSSDQSPILCFPKFSLRPQHGRWIIIPTIQQADPDGYSPIGGRISGVNTGLRRDLLEELIVSMEAIPALATKHLQIGHSLTDISGAWVSLPKGKTTTQPLFEQLDQHLYLLLGGPQADTYGAATAQALSQELHSF